jgi:hypothetical protein
MALVLADRVKETTTTVGTGTVTLLGASPGFQSFAAVGNANTTYYTIAGQTTSEWEVGIGAYTASGTTLSRTTVLSSSNGGSLVSFSAGTKDVFVTYPSERSVNVDSDNAVVSVPQLAATSITDSGNLTFTGTGNRITGDFSNATVANRVFFQTSTTNGATTLGIVPNGTDTTANFASYGNSADLANSSIMFVGVSGSGTEVRLNSAISGTGTYLPMTFYTGGSERMRLDTSGNVGIGTATPGTKLQIVAAGSTDVRSSVGNANAGFQMGVEATGPCLLANFVAQPIYFATNGTERMRIDSSGNVLIGTTTSPAGSKELVLGGDYIEGVVAIGTVTSTNTIALTNGTVQTATLTASTACTFTMPTATAGKSFVLLLKQAATTGNGTATFTGVKFGSSGAPTITATAGKMDILTFIADGTNWYGSAAQGYTP